MVARRDGILNDALLVEVIIRQCVHNGIILEKICNDSLGFHIIVKVLCVRLVGDVIEATLVVSALLHVLYEGLQECAEKLFVLLRVCVRIPTEYLLVLAVNGCHNLRCVICTPLCEEVRNFKIFDSDSVTHLDPSVEQLISK